MVESLFGLELPGFVAETVWADGIYSTLKGEDDRLCLLILMGVNEQGEKRLLALAAEKNWLRIRGFKRLPEVVNGSGFRMG